MHNVEHVTMISSRHYVVHAAVYVDFCINRNYAFRNRDKTSPDSSFCVWQNVYYE